MSCPPPSTPGVEGLASLDLEALRTRWRELYGPAPPLRSPGLLRRIIAWRLQARDHPALADALERALRCGLSGAKNPERPVGSLLTRTWRGVQHQVQVVAGGYAWNGQVYPTLSEVTALITRGRRDGASFFGDRSEGPRP